MVQASGERGPSRNEPISPERLEALGRSVLSAVDALDSAPDVTQARQQRDRPAAPADAPVGGAPAGGDADPAGARDRRSTGSRGHAAGACGRALGGCGRSAARCRSRPPRCSPACSVLSGPAGPVPGDARAALRALSFGAGAAMGLAVLVLSLRAGVVRCGAPLIRRAGWGTRPEPEVGGPLDRARGGRAGAGGVGAQPVHGAAARARPARLAAAGRARASPPPRAGLGRPARRSRRCRWRSCPVLLPPARARTRRASCGRPCCSWPAASSARRRRCCGASRFGCGVSSLLLALVHDVPSGSDRIAGAGRGDDPRTAQLRRPGLARRHRVGAPALSPALRQPARRATSGARSPRAATGRPSASQQDEPRGPSQTVADPAHFRRQPGAAAPPRDARGPTPPRRSTARSLRRRPRPAARLHAEGLRPPRQRPPPAGSSPSRARAGRRCGRRGGRRRREPVGEVDHRVAPRARRACDPRAGAAAGRRPGAARGRSRAFSVHAPPSPRARRRPRRGCPVTPTRSPARAPARATSSARSSAQPTAVTDTIRTGAATTSPPAMQVSGLARRAPPRRASARAPPARRSRAGRPRTT